VFRVKAVGAGFISARVAPQARYLVGAGFISARVACLCSSQKQMAFSLFERYWGLSPPWGARRAEINPAPTNPWCLASPGLSPSILVLQ
jgi:hypothetical protein